MGRRLSSSTDRRGSKFLETLFLACPGRNARGLHLSGMVHRGTVGRRSLGEIVAKDLSQDWLTELAGMRGFLCEVRYSAAGARKVPFPLRKLSGAEAWPSIQTF
jgi:hypothetical protein